MSNVAESQMHAPALEFIDLKSQYRQLKSEIDARIHAVLDHGQYIMGPEVEELERQLAAFVGARHCIGVSDGTTALMIALMALGIKPGDEVITTPFTFIATGEMIALLGARPVFVDIDPLTYNIDPLRLEAAITERTRAIMPVSLYGQCADFDAINDIASRHDLPVVEDGAQSFGATYRGRRSCGLSTIGSTSFFPSKPLGCYGDGGALFTDDDRLGKLMREIRVHGQDRRYHHPIVGLNGRLDTLQAAILIGKMKVFPLEVEARRRIGVRFSELLRDRLGDRIITPTIAPGNTSVYAQFTIRVPNRERIAAALKAAGIPTAVHYPIPLHLQPAMAACGYGPGDFPISEKAGAEVMSLPMHPYLTDDQMVRMVGGLADALA